MMGESRKTSYLFTVCMWHRKTMGNGSFPGVKRPVRVADHPPPSKCRGLERVELYLYSPSGPSWPVIGGTFTLCDIVRQVYERWTNSTLLLSVQSLYCTSGLILFCLSHEGSRIWRLTSLTNAKILSLLLPVFGLRIFEGRENFYSYDFMILCDFCLLPA